MKIRYSPEADVLVIELKKGILSDSIDLKEGIILHLNKKREPLKIILKINLAQVALFMEKLV